MLHFRTWITSIFCVLVFTGDSLAQLPVQDNLKLSDIRMHDPWIVADQASKTYYMYEGSGPQSSSQHRSGVIAYKSKDMKSWSGPHLVFEVPDGSWADPTAGVWAPEVHLYNGKYYLFATLNNYKVPLSKPSPSGNPRSVTHIDVTYGGVGWHLRGT